MKNYVPYGHKHHEHRCNGFGFILIHALDLSTLHMPQKRSYNFLPEYFQTRSVTICQRHRRIAKSNYRGRTSWQSLNLKYTILEITMLKLFWYVFKHYYFASVPQNSPFCKILTHVSMGYCFFPMRSLCPPPRTRMPLGKKVYCIYIQLICEWDCGSWGEKHSILSYSSIGEYWLLM